MDMKTAHRAPEKEREMATMFKIQATVGGVDASVGAEVLGGFAGRLFATEAEAETAVAELAASVPAGHEGIEYEVLEAREREVREYLDSLDA